MEKIEIDEIKSYGLELLDLFDKICMEHNLKYSVAFGTMLGAVRHGGFIPWDDDIDVVMPREDYEKLICLNINNEVAKVLSIDDDNYYYCYAKMVHKKTHLIEHNRIDEGLGVFIDIFPMESINFFPRFFRKISYKINNHIYWLGCKNSELNAVNRFEKNNLKKIIKYFNKAVSHKKKFNAKYTTCLLGFDNRLNQYYDISVWNNLTRCQFENIKVNIFSDYNDILSKLYGDYMTLPKNTERITHHNFTAYKK